METLKFFFSPIKSIKGQVLYAFSVVKLIAKRRQNTTPEPTITVHLIDGVRVFVVAVVT